MRAGRELDYQAASARHEMAKSCNGAIAHNLVVRRATEASFEFPVMTAENTNSIVADLIASLRPGFIGTTGA